jgi:TPR repeat protein
LLLDGSTTREKGNWENLCFFWTGRPLIKKKPTVLGDGRTATPPYSYYELGWRYEHGVGGVDQDYGKARLWYQQAADAGNTNAKEALTRLPSK